MSFMFVRYAAIFCAVAFLVALCADVLKSLALILIAQFSHGGVMFGATRRGWLVIFAAWWLISFLIALPLARKFSGLPFPLF